MRSRGGRKAGGTVGGIGVGPGPGQRCRVVTGSGSQPPTTHVGPLADRVRARLPLVRRDTVRRAKESLLDDPLRESDLTEMQRLFRVTDASWTQSGRRPVALARVRLTRLLFPLLTNVEGFQAAATRMHLRHDHDAEMLEIRVRDLQREVQELQRRTGHHGQAASRHEGDPAPAAGRRHRLGDLPAIFDTGPVVDLRCGDGELLDALRVQGVAGVGVDDDHATVTRCRARGHDAWVERWTTYVGQLRHASVGGIVVPPSLDDLPGPHRRRVLDAVVRALLPGGRVALETRAGATRPGHAVFQDRWPLPPDVLADALAMMGFEDVEIRAGEGDPVVTGRSGR